MISAADLASMRTSLTESMPDSCQVRRNAPTPDGAGGQIDAESTVATVACRISPLSRSDRLAELEIADRLTAVASWLITLPAGTDVTEKDRILSGVRTFEVASVLGPRTWELAVRLVGQEVE